MTQAPTTPYQQEASREEKAAIIQNEKRLNTRAAMTSVLDPALAGRFAATAKADFTVGRDPTVEYPKLPDGSPWRQQQPPDEEPLGFSVEEMPVMGEPFEQERAYLLSAAASVASSGGGEAGTSSPATAADLSSFSEGSADPASTSPVASEVEADPLRPPEPGPSASSFAEGQQLAAPPTDAEASRKGDTPRVEHRRGGAATFSRPSFRRIG
jgi:hypothetical protein